MANRLANETSPYLLQHKDNPVDWYPWGEEALQRARDEDRPILLSIGYSSCHWCHVMAHESFENPAIAEQMNTHFVNIKVDREERPDLDALYMTATQMMTGHGGWPMTVFLMPDGRPFYAGTYYPPEDRGTIPGFPRVLRAVTDAYSNRRTQIDSAASQIAVQLRTQFDSLPNPSTLSPALLDTALRQLTSLYDRENGGFGGAPKFPPPMALELLLNISQRTGSERALQMVEHTLDTMGRGGLYDQVGGGFHRYTVDANWLVPHFEKMLYDNALLAHAYTVAWQLTDEPFFRAIAEETLAYVLREMTDPAGGFYSAQDADSEGVEGRFYVWRPEQMLSLLGNDEGQATATLLGVTDRGNFEGTNVLSIPHVEDRMRWRSDEFKEARDALYFARSKRIWPGRDQKVVTAWNGLMLRAMATAAWAFDDARYREAAERNARFTRQNLFRDGRLLRVWTDGHANVDAFLEDYANLIDGLLALYRATFAVEWIDFARQLASSMLVEFNEGTAFYDTGIDHDNLIGRPRDVTDAATPSGTSVACDVLLRLGHLTGDIEMTRIANEVLSHYAVAAEQPQVFARLLSAIDLAIGPKAEVAITGEADATDTQALLAPLRDAYLPRVTIAVAPEGTTSSATIPLLEGRPQQDGRATAYVCVNYACQLPTNDPAVMMQQIRDSVSVRTSFIRNPEESGY